MKGLPSNSTSPFPNNPPQFLQIQGLEVTTHVHYHEISPFLEVPRFLRGAGNGKLLRPFLLDEVNANCRALTAATSCKVRDEIA